MISTESIWNKLLSRSEDSILTTYNELNNEEKRTVIDHLKKMVTEGGWHIEQMKSARLAITVIEEKGIKQN